MTKKGTDAIVIEKYKPEYLNGIAELRDSYRTDSLIKGNILYSWELEENPIGKPEAMIARDGDKIVAMLIAVLKKLYIAGNQTIVAEIQDSYTHRDYQGRGLFSKLTREIIKNLKERHINLIYGIPNENNYPIFVKKLGFYNPFEIRVLYKFLKMENLLKLVFRNEWICNHFALILNSILFTIDTFSITSNTENISIETVERFPEEISDLFIEARKDFDVIVERTQSYLNWRFCVSPRKYLSYIVKRDGRIVGYFVLKITNDGQLIKGYVIDFFSYKDSRMVRSILKNIIKIFRENNVDVIIAWMNQKAFFYRILRFMLFFPSRKSKHFIIYDEGNNSLLSKTISSNESWYFVVGDSDNM